MKTPIRRRITTATVLLLSTGLLAACGSSTGAAGGTEPTTLNLVGFAVPKAGNNAVQQEFAQTDEGAGVTWKESYGASGDQSRAVEGGLDADYVHFSVTPDVTRLVDAGLVEESWDDGPTNGIVTDSVVVFAVRAGNPKNITTWEDLIEPGVGIVTPNPGSSGAARWNILGAWQNVIAEGGSEDDVKEYLAKFLANVKAFPGSGRDATQAFQSGTGDVLISYENEAILARQQGEELDYVVPDSTLLIENPAAVTVDAAPKAQAFLDYALTPEGQAVYASKGFRPVQGVDGVEVGEVEGANDPSDPFPEVSRLFTIEDDFGGWSATNEKFFDEEDGIITQLQIEAGLE